MLGSTLFLVFVNDLLDGIGSEGKLFADDAKISQRVVTPYDAENLQADLQKLEEWSQKWSLSFNKDKCAVMHFGRNNQGYTYSLNGSTLSSTSKEKDLGIIVTSDLKPSAQAARAAATASSMLGRIRRIFTCLDVETMPALYNALVRPHMDYAIQTWSPYFKRYKYAGESANESN